MASDVELFEAWRAGDKRAGSRLFDRHGASLFRFFRNKVGDAAAEDLVQETFLACVGARERFRGDASFRTYLFTAARSRLVNFVTRDRKKSAQVDFGVTSIRDLGLSPVTELGRQQERRMLLEALRALPLDLQIAIELYYFEQLPGPELASVLGVPEGTVRGRLRKARQLLEAELDALGRSARPLADTTSDLEAWARELRGLDFVEFEPLD